MNKQYLFFWLFTITLFVFLILPGLFMDGMFADGTQYSCVSKNLAEGLGSFWFPFLSETWSKAGFNAFMEQPPLMYALQAPFYKILGDSLFVERFYTLLTSIFSTFMIINIWRKIAPAVHRKLSWLPILFWLTIPLMSWTYRQNMQENTMGMFTIMAVYFGVNSIYNKRLWFLHAVFAGCSIFLASFTKGIPGLFPIVIAGIAWITIKPIKLSRTLLLSFIYIAVPVVIYGILLQNDTAHESLMFYFNSRLMNRVESAPVVNNHFYMSGRLFMELIPSIVLLLLILLISKIKQIKHTLTTEIIRKGVFFLLIGLSASLPLMITLVQRGFYMSISFPYFGIAFALISAPYVDSLIQKIKSDGRALKILTGVSVFLIASGIVLTVFMAGKPGKNKELLSDVYTMGKYLEPYHRVSCDGPSYHYWPFQFYMLRYNNIYLEKSPRLLPYFIVKKGEEPDMPEQYELLDIKTFEYDLYRKLTN